jgi:predicted molibdopterin-dependent oxidoreductase YjgC
MGYEIPALCYAKGAVHKSSCMVCAVKNRTNGQIIPSCTTYPAEGMTIETDSDEIHQIRTFSLELLLSDHRADCDAPCSMVCPRGLDIEQVLSYYDENQHEKAYMLISEVFSLPEIACDNCKAPCEKACRRGTVDNAVSIREIIRQIAGMTASASIACTLAESTLKSSSPDKNKPQFQSRLGRFTLNERERLKSGEATLSRCLHCACTGRTNCKLRKYATAEGIKRPRYEATSTLPAMNKQQINETLWFEQAKCIRCGLCVYNSENGFTFKNRGFGMQVVLPGESINNVDEALCKICPTQALYISSESGFSKD